MSKQTKHNAGSMGQDRTQANDDRGIQYEFPYRWLLLAEWGNNCDQGMQSGNAERIEDGQEAKSNKLVATVIKQTSYLGNKYTHKIQVLADVDLWRKFCKRRYKS